MDKPRNNVLSIACKECSKKDRSASDECIFRLETLDAKKKKLCSEPKD